MTATLVPLYSTPPESPAIGVVLNEPAVSLTPPAIVAEPGPNVATPVNVGVAIGAFVISSSFSDLKLPSTSRFVNALLSDVVDTGVPGVTVVPRYLMCAI